MFEQGRLAFITDLPRRPKNPERLFFAVQPDPATARRIDALRRRLVDEIGIEGAAIEVGRLHVSLHLVGDFPRLRSDRLFAARMAADEVAVGPFEVTFDSLETFPVPPGREARRPLVLRGGSDGLAVLHQALGTAMRRNGLRAGTGCKAHITLSYGPTAVARRPAGPIRVTVDDFRLIHSERGLTRYHVLDRWTLRGRPASNASSRGHGQDIP